MKVMGLVWVLGILKWCFGLPSLLSFSFFVSFLYCLLLVDVLYFCDLD